MNGPLQHLLREAFEEKEQVKTAAPAAQTKIASGPTSTKFLTKVALALENIASGFEKGAQYDAPLGAQDYSPEQWVTDEEGPLDLSTGETQYAAAGQMGSVPEGDPANPNLGGWVPENNMDDTPGYQTPGGVDFDALNSGMVTTAAERVKAAEARVMGRVKAAMLKAGQAAAGADASIPPDGTIKDNLGGDGGGLGTEGVGAQGSMSEIKNPKSDVPQSTEGVVGLTNTEANDARKAELAAALGPAAVAAADADKTEEQVLEHSSGDEMPTDKQAAQAAQILNRAVLSRIAQGG